MGFEKLKSQCLIVDNMTVTCHKKTTRVKLPLSCILLVVLIYIKVLMLNINKVSSIVLTQYNLFTRTMQLQ